MRGTEQAKRGVSAGPPCERFPKGLGTGSITEHARARARARERNYRNCRPTERLTSSRSPYLPRGGRYEGTYLEHTSRIQFTDSAMIYPVRKFYRMCRTARERRRNKVRNSVELSTCKKRVRKSRIIDSLISKSRVRIVRCSALENSRSKIRRKFEVRVNCSIRDRFA